MVVSSGLPIVFASQPLPLKRRARSGVLCGWMKINTPSSSALAQNGWNFGSENSSPATLAPTAAPRSPSFFTPSTSCCTARSGNWRATDAKATKRSGYRAQNSASRSFWILITPVTTSRSARYHAGLMLSASMSIPCASISRMRRSPTSPIPGPRWSATLRPRSAYASGITQCACTSMVFARRPPTTTARRRPLGTAASRRGAAFAPPFPRAVARAWARTRAWAAATTSHAVKAMAAAAPAMLPLSAPWVVIGSPSVLRVSGRRNGRGAGRDGAGERRHQLAREPTQGRASAGAVEQHVLRARLPQRFHHAPDLVRRAVEGGGADLRVGQMRPVRGRSVRAQRQPIDPPAARDAVFSGAREVLGGPDDVDGPRDADAHRIEDPAPALDLDPEQRDALPNLLEGGVLVQQQVEAERRDFPDGGGAARAHPERRVRLLRGRRLDDHAVELPVRAAVRPGPVRRPRLAHDLQGFVEARVGLLHGRGEAGALVVPVAFADPEVEPAAGEQVDRRRLLRQQHGIVPGQYDHRAAQAHRGCARRDPREQG